MLISGSVVHPRSLRDHALCPPPQLPLLAMAALLHIHPWRALGVEGAARGCCAAVPLTPTSPVGSSALPPLPGLPGCIAHAGQCRGAGRARSALAAQHWNARFPPHRPGKTGRRGIIEYISPEPIQPCALYEQCLLTELIFAK